ncbi:MAG: NTP transferase domain-containing protein [Chloroflexi bacterium]|nr:NTP transferase domain-containing protein [Chloroflexota bacterium]
MKAVILAAGEGTRMRPLTYTRPKVMLPIANKPILEHLLIEAKAAGIQDFIFIVGYHDEQVRGYFGNGEKWGVVIEYYNQRIQLGTADALRMVEVSLDGNFLMMNGDIVVNRKDISLLSTKNQNAMSLIKVTDTRGLGVVELSEGKVVRIHEKTEKPPSDMANAGLYFFTPEIFTAIAQTPKSPRGEYELTASIQLMVDRGTPVSAQEIGEWLDLSYPWDLLSANEKLLASMKADNEGQIEQNTTIKGSVSIGKDTVVRSGSYIVGPVIIGSNCDIGPNCFIRASTAIGDNCHIGAGVEVKNCIVMRGSKIPHLSYVGDSIIGEDCNLGAGATVANLKLDKKNITVAGIDTKRRKLGVIMGDRVEVGINASINVGTMIGNDAKIGPGALAHGIISPGSKKF